jgi:uncharacterized phage infection (PIP) family protein YhgE
MAVSIDDLKTTLDTLESNFDKAYAAAPSAQGKEQLRTLLSAARDAYWKAMADGLSDDNSFVSELSADLRKKNRELIAATEQLQDFTGFLSAAKEAVKLAAAVASLAATT